MLCPGAPHCTYPILSPGQEDTNKEAKNLTVSPATSSGQTDFSLTLKSPWKTWGSERPPPLEHVALSDFCGYLPAGKFLCPFQLNTSSIL